MNLMNAEKHYNTLTNYYKNRFNAKVCKISLNAKFSCPNKDGTVGFGGCSYCSRLGSGDFAGDAKKPFKQQFEDVKALLNKKWPNAKYIAYLQANSNTYAPLDKLKKIYEEIISLDENIVMLSIATRPDCLEEDKIQYLAQLNKKIPIQIELGLQTIHENTAKLINRGHDLACFINCVKRLREMNIEVIVHVINGLPGETKEMMLQTTSFLNDLDIQGIKIHSLTIIENTKMGEEYKTNPWPLLSLEEYANIVYEQIRHLNDKIIIHRLAADANHTDLIAPSWTVKKMIVMNEIDKLMRLNNAYQGDLL